MEPIEYIFTIDTFTPDTLPMARLAEYLAALARMLGHPEHTHFVRVEPGSARLVHRVDPVDAPKVEARLEAVRVGDPPREAAKARRAIDELLANDNAVGELISATSGRVVVPFTGRNRPRPLTFPPFRDSASIDGQVVSIGGRDRTAHATLQDGEVFHTGVEINRELARDLAKLLYGPTVRLHGSGRFERQADGAWKMLDFRVERFERLDDRLPADAFASIRAIPENRLMEPNAYRDVAAIREGSADDQ